jgi:hypothetical protein
MKGKVRPRYCDSIKLKESACKLLDRSRRLRTSGPQNPSIISLSRSFCRVVHVIYISIIAARALEIGQL